MQRIRPRTRVDVLRAEHRAAPIRWGRWLYLAILIGLGLAAANWAVGSAVLLRADGLVLAERSIAAATYGGRVARVHVREGQRVRAGEVVVELESADMLRDIAQVSAQNAEFTTRELQLRARVAALAALMPLAERHSRESTEAVSRLDSMSSRGLVSAQRLGEALGTQYEAAARLAALQAEAALLASELPMVARSRQRAAETLNQLEAFYDGGLIRAARDGTVGARVPVHGQVVRVGEDLLQVHGDEVSVLAYLPDLYLFGLSPGDRVTVGGAYARVDGVVEALLPVTDALPLEFQSMFRPRDRSRLIRIRLASAAPFAVSQKVQVGGCALGWCWRSEPLPSALAGMWQRLRAVWAAA
jgi:multidrug resistance efflux pump